MFDGFVRVVRVHAVIEFAFIGHEAAFASDVALHDFLHDELARNRHMEGADASAALDKGEDGTVVADFGLVRTAFAVRRDAGFFCFAVIGFVHFNDLAFATKRDKTASAHGFTNAMGEEPCGFVRDLKRPVELMGANALLAGGHEGERLKPNVELDVGAFHDRLGGHGEVLTASRLMAAPDARTALIGVVLTHGAAVRANRLALPAEGFEEFPGFVVALKMGFVEHGQGPFDP